MKQRAIFFQSNMQYKRRAWNNISTIPSQVCWGEECLQVRYKNVWNGKNSKKKIKSNFFLTYIDPKLTRRIVG